MGGCEPWEALDDSGDGAGIVELAATIDAVQDMRLEGRRPEANLVVEELVDFVGQEVSVHCGSFTVWSGGVFQKYVAG
jgi:hypothetical protein